MFKAISIYCYTLTRDNWGVPWHLWISTVLSIALLGLLNKWFGQSFGWTAVLSFLVVMIIGYINEVAQMKKDQFYKRADFWQDMIANALGSIAGLVIAWALLWWFK